MALALDGSGDNYQGNTNSISVTLTTAHSPDVIILFIMHDNLTDTISSVSDTASLTWTLRKSNTSPSGQTTWEYYAIASGTLSSDSVTVAFSAADNSALVVFGVSGANTSSPFDSHSGIPATNSGNWPTAPSASISTSNADDMIIGMMNFDSTGATVAAGGSFTLIAVTNSSGWKRNAAEYQVVSATQSGLSVPFTMTTVTGTPDWGVIADAIQAAAAAASFPLPAPAAVFRLPVHVAETPYV